jgi:hypothetical protein
MVAAMFAESLLYGYMDEPSLTSSRRRYSVAPPSTTTTSYNPRRPRRISQERDPAEVELCLLQGVDRRQRSLLQLPVGVSPIAAAAFTPRHFREHALHQIGVAINAATCGGLGLLKVGSSHCDPEQSYHWMTLILAGKTPDKYVKAAVRILRSAAGKALPKDRPQGYDHSNASATKVKCDLNI